MSKVITFFFVGFIVLFTVFVGGTYLTSSSDRVSDVEIVSNIERYTTSVADEQLNLNLSPKYRQANILYLDSNGTYNAHREIKDRVINFIRTNYKNIKNAQVVTTIDEGKFIRTNESTLSQTRLPKATVYVSGEIINTGIATNKGSRFNFNIEVGANQLTVDRKNDNRDNKPIVNSGRNNKKTTDSIYDIGDGGRFNITDSIS